MEEAIQGHCSPEEAVATAAAAAGQKAHSTGTDASRRDRAGS